MLNEPFYTVREASEKTRLAYWTVWDKLKKGEIGKVKVGKKVFIRESELKKLFVDVPAKPQPARRHYAKREVTADAI